MVPVPQQPRVGGILALDEDGTNVAVYYNVKDKPCGYMVYLIKNDIMHIKEMVYLNREAQKGLWEYIHAHDSMIDEVHGSTYFSEPIAFEMDDGDIKESIRPMPWAASSTWKTSSPIIPATRTAAL